jgi:hypothetical protein
VQNLNELVRVKTRPIQLTGAAPRLEPVSVKNSKKSRFFPFTSARSAWMLRLVSVQNEFCRSSLISIDMKKLLTCALVAGLLGVGASSVMAEPGHDGPAPKSAPHHIQKGKSSKSRQHSKPHGKKGPKGKPASHAAKGHGAELPR